MTVCSPTEVAVVILAQILKHTVAHSANITPRPAGLPVGIRVFFAPINLNCLNVENVKNVVGVCTPMTPCIQPMPVVRRNCTITKTMEQNHPQGKSKYLHIFATVPSIHHLQLLIGLSWRCLAICSWNQNNCVQCAVHRASVHVYIAAAGSSDLSRVDQTRAR